MPNTFTVASVVQSQLGSTGRLKTVTLTATGPSTYNSTNVGYGLIDLSTSEATLGQANGFTRVYTVERVAVGAYTSGRYSLHHTYGTTPATTALTVRDEDSSAAVVAINTDLSSHTFYLRVTGY